jgi:transcriptional regulator with XRE-family HTH domain
MKKISPKKIPLVVAVLIDRLKKFLEERDLAGYELADKADISPVTISRILTGKMPKVSLDEVQKIAIGLGVTMDDLVGEKNLYPEHDRKMQAVREQFEKYGYDKADTILKIIPTLPPQPKEDGEGPAPEPGEKIKQTWKELGERGMKPKKKGVA